MSAPDAPLDSAKGRPVEARRAKAWREAIADLPRVVAAFLLAGSLAPLLFTAIMGFWAAVLAGDGFTRGPSGSINEIIGLALVAVVLGAPVSVGVALAAGLPSIYLARRLHLTSPWVFGVGGAVLALACTAGFAAEDVVSAGLSRLPGWSEFAGTAAVTGALCGCLCWTVSERCRRSAQENVKGFEWPTDPAASA